ncbi:MAG: phosphoserine phosphatase RsbU/P [Humisphaera sp.]|nr:phosphoserine phosphatase RsbU/P [Humisphaera sp.]
MEKAARRFTTWVLSLHVLVLALLIVIVALASNEVYSKARRQALDQVRVRQELLAAQSARGIEYFYRSILNDLELQRRAVASGGRTGDLGPLMWEQLRGRAVRLFEVQGPGLANVTAEFGDENKTSAREIVDKARAELALMTQPGVTSTYDFNGTHAALAVMPIDSAAAGAGPRMLIAVIPTRSIETRFLNDLNESESISALVLNEKMVVLSAEDKRMIGTNLTDVDDPRVRLVAQEYMQKGQRGTREFLEPFKVRDLVREPAMVTAQPIDLPDGKKWWLAVSSTLGEVEAAVGAFFRRVVIGAGLVIFAMTAILVSTSTQMIRGRLRLERVQREMLTRELNQAREIQLLWLPERQGAQIALDVAAVNRPASHISGDFYNWFELPDGRACVVIGDVTGHGLPAAFLMATTQLLVRTIITRVGDPGPCLREANRQLCTHVFSGQFVTLLVMVIDPETNVVELATAGHPPPFVGSGEAFAPLPVEAQLVLAVDQDVAYKTQRFELKSGTSLLLFTDGVTDVQSPSGDRLGAEGVQKTLYGSFTRAKTLLDTVLDTVDNFRAGREMADDLTLVAVQLTPKPAIEPEASTLAAAR